MGLTVSDLCECVLSCLSPTHIAKDSAAASDELLEVGREVVAAVVFFYFGRPVGLACANKNLLRVVGYESVELGFMVDLEAGGHFGGWCAAACW
jgi:hypothetical protein